jgi:hypothetical protein
MRRQRTYHLFAITAKLTVIPDLLLSNTAPHPDHVDRGRDRPIAPLAVRNVHEIMITREPDPIMIPAPLLSDMKTMFMATAGMSPMMIDARKDPEHTLEADPGAALHIDLLVAMIPAETIL